MTPEQRAALIFTPPATIGMTCRPVSHRERAIEQIREAIVAANADSDARWCKSLGIDGEPVDPSAGAQLVEVRQDAAILEEREACAVLVETKEIVWTPRIQANVYAKAIRERGES